MINFWLILTLLLSLLQWLSRWYGWKRRNIFSKPASLIAMIIWSLSVSGWHGHLFWFGLALIFSLLGDVLLMLPPRYFLPGLAAFMSAHTLYIIGLNHTFPAFSLPLLLIGLPLLIITLIWVRIFYKNLKKKSYSRRFRVPAVIYSLVISIMLFSALSTLFRPDWPLQTALFCAAGALLFVSSDSLLAYDRFFKPIEKGQFWIMLTYHLGQLLLVAGAILRFG